MASYYKIGKISKPHGVKGQMQSQLVFDDEDILDEQEVFFLLLGTGYVPYFVTEFRMTASDKAIIAFEEVTNPEKANKLRDVEFYVPLDAIPEELRENDWDQIIGYKCIDKRDGEIGIIEDILEAPSQLLLSIKHKGKEVLIPLVDAFVDTIDDKAKTLYTNLPEGLLEVYTSTDSNQPDDAD